MSTAFLPISYPSSGPPVKFTPLKFRDKDLVGNHVKGLAQVQVYNISHHPLLHQSCHSIIEGHQIGYARPSSGEAVLAVLDHTLIPHMIKHVIHEDLFSDVPGTDVRLSSL